MSRAAARAALLAALVGGSLALARAEPPGPAPRGEGPEAADGGPPAAPAMPFGPGSVWAVVQEHQAELTACYEQRLAEGKSVRGEVVLSFVIGRDGVPAKARVKKSTLADAAVETCLLRAARTWVFPRPSADQPVDLPLHFDEARRQEKP